MAVFSRKSTAAGTLRWSEIVPGRLLRIRCELKGMPIDVLNVYQKVRVAGSEEVTQKNIAERAYVWAQLDKWCKSVPLRNVVLVAGDFNTAFPPGFTGNSVDGGKAHRAYVAEAAEQADILARAGLVACNTFGRRLCTFLRPQGESLIDYVMTRRGTADAEARRTRPVETPVAGWRKGGQRVLGGVSLLTRCCDEGHSGCSRGGPGCGGTY